MAGSQNRRRHVGLRRRRQEEGDKVTRQRRPAQHLYVYQAAQPGHHVYSSATELDRALGGKLLCCSPQPPHRVPMATAATSTPPAWQRTLVCASLTARVPREMAAEVDAAAALGADVAELQVGCLDGFEPRRDLPVLLAQPRSLPVIVTYRFLHLLHRDNTLGFAPYVRTGWFQYNRMGESACSL